MDSQKSSKKQKVDEPNRPPSVSQNAFGQCSGGEEVQEFVLLSGGGLEVKIISFGATITSVKFPDKQGLSEELTLQYSDLHQIEAATAYYGSTVGRVANRIAGGKFALDDQEFQLATNNGPNHLHGGIKGWSHKVWAAEAFSSAADAAAATEEKEEEEEEEEERGGGKGEGGGGAGGGGEEAGGGGGGRAGVRFRLVSPDGDEGYPGEVQAEVEYSVTSSNELHCIYKATSDKPTPCNLTNHAYWNLSGDGKEKVVGGSHVAKVFAESYLALDENSIPTGALDPAAADPLLAPPAAFPGGGPLPAAEPPGGLDHCYVIRAPAGGGAEEEHGHGGGGGGKGPNKLLQMAFLLHPESGRKMEVWGTQPGLQVYTANYLSTSDSDKPHTFHNAVCLETQHFPNAVNQPEFDSVILRPGAAYHEEAVFKFSIDEGAGV